MWLILSGADPSSSGWIQVAADFILQLTRVLAAGYELRLILSCGWLELWRLDTSCGFIFLFLFFFIYPILIWLFNSSHSCLEFQRLDRSCGWFHHTADSSSSGWIGVAVNSILQLFRIPAAGYKMWLTLFCSWLECRWLDTSYSWFHLAAGYYKFYCIRCDLPSVLVTSKHLS